MNKLIGVMAILSLWGCGPEQSAADRDEQQINAQYQEYKSQLAPYVGVYTGTITSNGNSLQVSLILNPADIVSPNSSTLKNTKIPTLNGTLNLCYSSGCFTSDPTNTSDVDQSIQVTGANYNTADNTVTLTTTQNVTNCSGLGTQFCSNFTIDLQWTSVNRTGLHGNMNNAGNSNTTLDVVKRQ